MRRLAVHGANVQLTHEAQRGAAAREFFAATDRGRFDLDLEAIDRLNAPVAVEP